MHVNSTPLIYYAISSIENLVTFAMLDKGWMEETVEQLRFLDEQASMASRQGFFSRRVTNTADIFTK